MNIIQKKRSNSIINEINKQILQNFGSEHKYSRKQQDKILVPGIWDNIHSQPQENIITLKSDQSRQNIIMPIQYHSQNSQMRIKQSPIKAQQRQVKKTPSTSLHTPADLTLTTKQIPSTQTSCRSKLFLQLSKRKNVIESLALTQKISHENKCILDYRSTFSTQIGFVTDFCNPYYISEDKYYQTSSFASDKNQLISKTVGNSDIYFWKEKMKRKILNKSITYKKPSTETMQSLDKF